VGQHGERGVSSDEKNGEWYVDVIPRITETLIKVISK
jgi:hypothetical protein